LDTGILSKLYVVIGASTSSFTTALTDLNGQVKSAEKDWTKSFGAIGAAMKTIGTQMAVAGAAIVVPMTLAVKTFAETAEATEILSQKTGLSTTAIQELGFALNLTGGSVENLQTSMKIMATSITDMSGSSEVAQKAIASLGLNLKTLQAMTPDQQFMTLASAIAGIQDPTERAATATAIFGKSAGDLLPMLADGAQGLQDYRNAAHSTGAVLSDLQIATGAKLQNSLETLKASFAGMSANLASLLAPALTTIINKIGSLIKVFTDWSQTHSGLAKVILIVVGVLGILLTVMGGLLASMGMLLTAQNIAIITVVAQTVVHAALAISYGVVTAAQWLWNEAMDANPIGLLILGIVALIAAVILIAKNWDVVREKTVEIWNTVVDFLKGIWDNIVGFFKTNWALILAILFPAVGLPILIAQNWGKITGIVSDIWNGVVSAIKTAWNNVVTFVESGVNWLIDQVNKVIDLMDKIPGVNIGNISHLGGESQTPIGPPIPTTIPSYDVGGMVRGAIGQPQVAVVHGGEMITPAGKGGILITGNNFAVRKNSDIDDIANALMRKIKLQGGYA